MVHERGTIQKRMKISEKGMNIDKIFLKFKNLLSKGKVNGALKLLIENMLNGILLLTDKTLQILKQEYPKANEPAYKRLLQGPTCPIHQINIQPFEGVLIKRCSENMQQIYRGAPMGKCDFLYFCHKNINIRSHVNQDRLHLNRKGQYMMGNNFSTFINSFYFWKFVPTTSTGMPGDCISNSQNSNEIRNRSKAAKIMTLSLYLESSA